MEIYPDLTKEEVMSIYSARYIGKYPYLLIDKVTRRIIDFEGNGEDYTKLINRARNNPEYQFMVMKEFIRNND